MMKARRCLAVLCVIAAAALGLGPTYAPGNALTLNPGTCVTLLNAENPATATFSRQFILAAGTAIPSPPSVSFEFAFTANPGAFNYQVQDADTDLTGNYVTLATAGTLTSCPVTAGGAFTCRTELAPWRANFGRIYINTQNANAVNVTIKACR